MNLSFVTKRFGAFICALAFGMLGALFARDVPKLGFGGQVLDWDKAIAAHYAYIDNPAPENAKAFLASLPADTPKKTVGNQNRALDLIFSGQNYWIIENEALAGDRVAVEIIFRLLNIAEGHDVEVVCSTLGWLVRNRPELFLDVFLSYADTQFVKTSEYPIFGADFGAQIGPLRHELEKRIEALNSVKEPRLIKIRDACIQRLREGLKELPR